MFHRCDDVFAGSVRDAIAALRAERDENTQRCPSRHRKDMGDIAALSASIADVGLLHPIVVTEDGILIAE